ncbi:MAG: dynamin family protein [Candidatus Promineifilaceae bacterium]
MSPKNESDKYVELRDQLELLPHIDGDQVEQWIELQRTIDTSRDYLIRAVPQAQQSVDEAQKILAQRTYTLVFFGGTGVGKSTLINALLGRNLLPTGAVTAVTGTIVYIEQADEGEPESLVFSFWDRKEFASRVRRLCQLAEIENFDINNDAEREQARLLIEETMEEGRDDAKTEQDEYFEILIDCIETFESKKELFQNGPPPSKSFSIDDDEALTHIREDGFKGSGKRQIRLLRSATFRIHARDNFPNLLMNGYLRIVDVPGLGAGMRLHEAITLEEMKREDAMIVLVTDAGRQRVDEMKSLMSVNWIKENRLFGLSGSDLDEAAAKVFLAVNGGNVRQAFDRLNAGLPESEREVKEVTRYIAPNYWERYVGRGDHRPYFLIMAPPALYVEDPSNSPAEFASETERVLKVFSDQLGPVNKNDPLDPETAQALLKLSEVPLLRDSLIDFIQTERVRSQLREASTRVRNAVQSLRFYYEKQLAGRGVHPPFESSWESLQERRFENVLVRQQKELPRAFHNALLDLSQRINSDERFHGIVEPTLLGVKSMVQDTVQREVETLLDSYGTEYWDDRDVTYDSLIWGTSGIEVPIKRIMYQVELVMQEAVSNFMPEVAEVIAAELERTLDSHDILGRLSRATYGQEYTYAIPAVPGKELPLENAFEEIVGQVGDNFHHTCRQATMYELVKPERSIHFKIREGEQELALPDEDRILDILIQGVDRVRQDMLNQSQLMAENAAARVAEASASDGNGPATEQGEDLVINILDAAPAEQDVEIKFTADVIESGYGELETSYAEKLDNIAIKTNRIFGEIIDDLFADSELLSRLRRLFWLEATKAERDFNTCLVKPMIRQHDRKLSDAELRQAMEVDLESISDVEELMRTWEGLHKLETELVI